MSLSDGASERSFWEWSSKTYAEPLASRSLLRLQDEFGFNVNILLWCCWCAQEFGPTTELTLRKAIDLTAGWSHDVTQVLRSARRALKTPPRQADADAAGRLRASVEAAELAAEKLEQDMLETLAREMLAPAAERSNPLHEARRSLARYAALLGAARRNGFSTLLLDDVARSVFAERAIEASE